MEFIEPRFLMGCKRKTKLISQSNQRKLIGQSTHWKKKILNINTFKDQIYDDVSKIVI
jgi:hypothetical protein